MNQVTAIINLTPQALGEIRDAIVAGYNHDTLNDLLRFNWGLKLSDKFNIHTGVEQIASQLLDYAETEGRVPELIALAYSGKPGNPKLQAAATKYLTDPVAALAKYDAAATPELPRSLQALVTSRSRLFNFGQFMDRVRSLGARICRVEVPGGGGTAWLAGKTHVLTNYHVMEPVLQGHARLQDVVFRFDFWSNDEGVPAPEGVEARADSVIEQRRYSQSDTIGTGAPAEDELDYALVKLTEPIGASHSNGAERGWFEFGPTPPIVARGDVAMIPQHARARPLEVAYGTVVDFPASGLRYRYNVTTEPGSSGSPVFTPDLNLFGLHHAAEPKHHPTYNQAVPLWRIARDLQSKQIVWVG